MKKLVSILAILIMLAPFSIQASTSATPNSTTLWSDWDGGILVNCGTNYLTSFAPTPADSAGNLGACDDTLQFFPSATTLIESEDLGTWTSLIFDNNTDANACYSLGGGEGNFAPCEALEGYVSTFHFQIVDTLPPAPFSFLGGHTSYDPTPVDGSELVSLTASAVQSGMGLNGLGLILAIIIALIITFIVVNKIIVMFKWEKTSDHVFGWDVERRKNGKIRLVEHD